MERVTVMKTFHGSSLTPPKPSNSNLRDGDASFSSYLIQEEPNNCQRHLTIGPSRCGTPDDSSSELSVFDAHKYFNELSNNEFQKVVTISSNSRVSPLVNLNIEHNTERSEITEACRYSSASSSVDGYANIRNYRTRSFHAATPTASSEASWNSQTGLLSHPPGAIAISMRNPSNPTDPSKKTRVPFCKPIWPFRSKCPCSGKKSVEVKKKATETKTQTPKTPPMFLPQNRDPRDSPDLKRQDFGTNPKNSLEKFTPNMETSTSTTTKPEPNKIPITPTNWVDQRPQDQQIYVTNSNSHRLPPSENQIPPILQSQRVLASVRPFSDGFTFPVLKPQSATPPIKLQVENNRDDEDPPRDSLEIFRPPDIESAAISPKTTDRNRQNFGFPQSPKSRTIDEDAASDASSDLFELESFSTQTTSTYPTFYGRRDSIDEASNFDPKRAPSNNNINNGAFLFGRRSIDGSTTPTITECYEPSEASIDWSVTTAEGFDRASVANFSVSPSELADDAFVAHGGDNNLPDKCKRRSSTANGLLSCHCEKAVSVVGPNPQPAKSLPAAQGQRGTTALTTTRHVSSRPVSVNNKPPLAKSQTARMSLPFAT